MDELILYNMDNGVATLTLNRPKALNALNHALLAELGRLAEQLDGDPDVRVVILTGAGEKAFAAGADIAEMAGLDAAGALAWGRMGQAVMDRLAALRPITIAAVNGYALGGGCELAMACDIRVVAEGAKLGIPEVTLGVIPGFGGTQRLPRLVGLGRALELLATGRRVDANEAKAIGLANHVVPLDQLQSFCTGLAGSILANSASAIALGKRAMAEGVEMDQARGLAYEAGQFAICFSTHDQREGMTAFLEKRKAQFE